ncbi:MAG: (5-formylfuran-3-yl)methyl phosphate synthase [Candidatus Heimdallarchaeota archaeon]
MHLLVSPQTLSEALECVRGNADIIDVKNPAEGSLGANFPWVIKEIRTNVPSHIPISATIGDVPFKPGTVALAALGAANAGASFVKVGLFGVKNTNEAVEIMCAVTRTRDKLTLPIAVVAAGYAEGKSIGSIDPLSIPKVALESSSDYVMIDTYNKMNGKSLFDLLEFSDLKKFISSARKKKLGVALGGSIGLKHIPILKDLKPDIVGIRGAVCENGDRIKGTIKAKLITEFLEKLKD